MRVDCLIGMINCYCGVIEGFELYGTQIVMNAADVHRASECDWPNAGKGRKVNEHIGVRDRTASLRIASVTSLQVRLDELAVKAVEAPAKGNG